MADFSLATVESSNLPTAQKSAIRRFYERMSHHGGSSLARAGKHVAATGHAVRQMGESGITGGLLGALHAELPNGLDVKSGGTNVPIDGVVAGVGVVGAIVAAHEEVGTDLRNIAASGFTILTFRKTHDWMHARKVAKGEAPTGKPIAKVAGDIDEGIAEADIGGDPVLEAARAL